jgi:hypothetical protein
MAKDNDNNNNNAQNIDGSNSLKIYHKDLQNIPETNKEKVICSRGGTRPFFSSSEHKEEYCEMLLNSAIEIDKLFNNSKQDIHSHNSIDDDDIER